MGRRSLDKQRITDQRRKLEWANTLHPFFQENGLIEPTMDDVAKYLGKSKATIYKYFRSKEEIVSIILVDRISVLRQFEHIIKDESIPYFDRYFKSVTLISENIGDITNRFMADLKQTYPEIWRQVELFREHSIDVLRRYYEEGMEKGYFQNLHPELLVQSDRFFFDTLTDAAFLSQHNLTMREAFTQYFSMKFYGIVSKNAVKDQAV